MNEFRIIDATDDDLDSLALMNKHLIEDSQHDNKMTVEQLKERMRSFMRGTYKAYLLMDAEKIRGYALVDHSTEPLYLKQFFIGRDSRQNGYGRRYFEELLQLLNTETLDLEVLYWNHDGYEFWKAMGFVERSIYMRYANH
mgnify:CR=1 FL=1